MDKIAAVDTAEGHGKCTRRFVKSVKKNVKFPSSLAETVLYTARSVFRSAEIVAVNSGS
jgi:hypothetical protein